MLFDLTFIQERHKRGKNININKHQKTKEQIIAVNTIIPIVSCGDLKVTNITKSNKK